LVDIVKALFNMKIGFFDSGLGGLTILKSVARELPAYDYSYHGDTANLPYGDRSEEEIYSLTKEGVKSLFEKDCLLVIIACNTASAETLRKLQDTWLPHAYPDRRILGVIVPTVEEVLKSAVQTVALLATKRTVDSDKYLVELHNRSSKKVVLSQVATPELVPFIELNELEAATSAAIKRIDTEAGESEGVILGCTHYTQIKDQLRCHYSDKKIFFSQDEIIPKKLFAYLENHPEIESRLTKTGERSIHLTQHRPDYDLIMGQFLGGAYLAEE
jgi:glutamate racemase